MIEYPGRCAVADALFEKFRERAGLGSVLFSGRGHYKEFSVSFDKYISGTKMTQQAKNYADGLRQQQGPVQVQCAILTPFRQLLIC